MNEMRKLMETLKKLDEDARPDPKIYLTSLRAKLYSLANKAAEYVGILNRYPSIDPEILELAKKVEVECDRLRKLIHDKL